MWVSGYLAMTGDCKRLRLPTRTGWIDLYCGFQLEVWRDGRWQRGRLEHDWTRGWFWTDDRQIVNLSTDVVARAWDGLVWPRVGDDRPGRDR